jgi:hemin uptake protein HemP
LQSYNHPSGKKIYIDAQYEESSNWLRWVNSARWAEEQNMFSIEHAGEVYYLLIRDTKAGDELLGNY